MSVVADRRRSPRHLVAVPCHVTSADRRLQTHIIELSAGGAQLACVGLDRLAQITVRTPAGVLDLNARVVRQEPGRTAVEFFGLDERRSRVLRNLMPAELRAA